jgi:hypothetical protein
VPEITPDIAKRRTLIWPVVVLCAVAVFVVGSIHTSQQNSAPFTAEEQAWIKNHPIIRFAPDPDFPPTEFFDGGGEYGGMTADYLALLKKKLGIHFKIIRLQNWDEVLSQAETRRYEHEAWPGYVEKQYRPAKNAFIPPRTAMTSGYLFPPE